jgi:hypothetical protein
MHAQLNDQDDVFIWNFHPHGQYIVHSLYLSLTSNGTTQMNKQIWWLKIPLKIKNFMWYMCKEVVLTKDNLARQNRVAVNNVPFIYMKNLYNIYSLTAIILHSCED